MLERQQRLAEPTNGISVQFAQAQGFDTEIQELARGLHNDPLRIYNYVRNRVDYIPYFGHLKGAKGTLLDLSGNDFDQAALLKELLAASGYQAEFAYGKMTMPAFGTPNNHDLAGWLGVASDVSIIGQLTANAGIPITGRSNGLNDVRRVWVKATIDGTVYHLDPAFKVYDRKNSIDVTQAIGYVEQDVKNAANATISSDWLEGVDDTAIRSKLSEYTNSLLAHLKANHPNDEITDVIGSKQLRRVEYSELPLHPAFGYTVDEIWSEVPIQFNHTLQVRHGELDEIFDLPDIIGKKLSISYKEITLPPAPQSFECFTGSGALDTWEMGSVVSVPQFGAHNFDVNCTVSNSSPNLVLGVFVQLPVETTDTFFLIDPNGQRQAGFSYFANPGQSLTFRVRFNGAGLPPGLKTSTLRILYRFQANGFDPIDRTTQIRGHVVEYPEATLSIDDVAYKTEPLPQNPIVDINRLFLKVDHPYAASNGTFADQETAYVVNRGGNYVLINEVSSRGADASLRIAQKKLAMLSETEPEGSKKLLTETLNVMGKSWSRLTLMNAFFEADLANVTYNLHHFSGIMAQEEGFYVDVKGASGWLIGNEPTVSPNPVFRSGSLIGSAAEHGMIQQQQVDIDAASTVKLLVENNESGDRTYLATSANWLSIRDQLNYSTEQKNEFENFLNSNTNARIVLPENGEINLDSWTGAGYISYLPDNLGNLSMQMTISGDLDLPQASAEVEANDFISGTLNSVSDFNLLGTRERRLHGGGFSTIPGEVDPFKPNFNGTNEFSPVTQTPIYNVIDPVDIATGDYLYDLSLLSFGNTEPRGLNLTASYSSRENRNNSGMGFGWVHSYDIDIREYTDAALSLGRRTAFDAAPAIVASAVLAELLESEQPTLEKWMIANAAANWQMDQITDKAVAIKLGRQNMTFVEMPDGNYISPPGSTQTLSKVNDQFVVEHRFGGGLNFNADNKLEMLSDVDGNSVSFSYQNDVLNQVTDTVGRTLTFAYANDQLQSVTDFTGRTIGFSYADGELETFTDVMNKDTTFTYDSNHRIDTVTNALGIKIVDNIYDSQGRVIRQDFPTQNGIVFNEIYYNDFSNSERDADGYLQFHYFDKKKRRVGLENALGELSQTVFDGQNHIIKEVDPLGNATLSEYDENQNLIQMSNAAGEVARYFYDGSLRLERVEDPMSNKTEYGYDNENHHTQTRTFPKSSEIITSTISYFDNGLSQRQTDGRNIETLFAYDIYGNPSLTTTTSHTSIATQYDNLGRLDLFTPPEGTATDYDYNNRGQITRITDPLNKESNFIFNDLGQTISRVDRNSKTTSTSYTPNRLPDTITFDNNNFIKFDYDNRNNIVKMTDPLGDSLYTYNEVNRLTSKTDPNGFIVSYGHDLNGRLTTLTYPGNKVVTYGYDKANRLETITNWLNEVTQYNYDEAGRLKRTDHPNGTSTLFKYDNANRIIKLSNFKSNGELINSQSFTLDKNGNPTEEKRVQPQIPTVQDKSVSYTYNAEKSRLIQVNDGNINNITYDNEGQVLSGAVHTFSFNDRYQVEQIDSDVFEYDGEGNRLKVTRNGVISYFIYDESSNLLAEADASKQIIRYFVHGSGLNQMIESGESYIYHFDVAGNTMAITDSSQNIINQYAYSPFGQSLGKTEQIGQPFSFVGQYGIQTEKDDIYFMRARYYDATLGRFISEDPIGFDGGVGLYAYVGSSNPFISVDPSGEVLLNVGAGIINTLIDVGVQYATTGEIDPVQAGIAFGAGFTGAAAATWINRGAQVVRGTRTAIAVEIGGNAIAGGTINTGASVLNGDGATASSFLWGAGGSLTGSAIGSAAQQSSNLALGARGVLNGAGRSISTGAEATIASGVFSGNTSSPSSAGVK